MLCHFARFFPGFVADFLESGLSLKRKFREETITDIMMANLKALGGNSVIVEFPNEPSTGADMEWFFVDTSDSTWFRLLIQAKRITCRGPNWQNHSYRDLFHISGGALQAETLANTASADTATFPLYAFYHPRTTCELANEVDVDWVEGVNLADGYFVASLAKAAISKKLKTQNKRLGTLHQVFFALAELFCPPHIVELGPMALGPSNIERFLTFTFQSGRPTLGMQMPPSPGDIRRRIQGQRENMGDEARDLPPVPPLGEGIPDDVAELLKRRFGGVKRLESGVPRPRKLRRVIFVSAGWRRLRLDAQQ